MLNCQTSLLEFLSNSSIEQTPANPHLISLQSKRHH